MTQFKPKREVMKHMLMMQTILALMDSGLPLDWDEKIRIEKSDLPKKEPMPITIAENEKLLSLSGKAKKNFLKELREKYQQ